MSLYIKASTHSISDPKFLRVGPKGFTLFMKGLMYSKEQLLDGFVPQEALNLIGTGVKPLQKVVRSLVENDLWDVCNGGYCVKKRRWENHQTTKDEVDKKREIDAKRKRAQRERERLAREKGENVTHDSHANVTHDSHAKSHVTIQGVTPLSEPEPEPEPENKDKKTLVNPGILGDMPRGARPADANGEAPKIPENDFSPNGSPERKNGKHRRTQIGVIPTESDEEIAAKQELLRAQAERIRAAKQ